MAEVLERSATIASVKSDTSKAPRLLDQVRERICVLHYARATEKTYLHWIKFYIHFHGLRHPRDMARKRRTRSQLQRADVAAQDARSHLTLSA